MPATIAESTGLKMIIDRKVGADAFKKLADVTPTRTPKECLVGVRITSNNDGVVLFATDLERWVQIRPGWTETTGSIDVVVPAKRVATIFATATDPTLTIHQAGRNARIVGHDCDYTLVGYDPDTFPVPKGVSKGVSFDLSAERFRQMWSVVRAGSAKIDTDYSVSGALIHSANKKVVFATCNGRSACIARSHRIDPHDFGRPVVSAKTMNTAASLFDDDEQQIKITFDGDSAVSFETNYATLRSPLLDVNFPPYEDCAPKSFDTSIRVVRRDFAACLRRVMFYESDAETKGVDLDLKKGNLVVRRPETSDGEAEVLLTIVDSKGGSFGVRARDSLLVAAAESLCGDEIELQMTKPNKPFRVNDDDGNYHIIMPTSRG